MLKLHRPEPETLPFVDRRVAGLLATIENVMHDSEISYQAKIAVLADLISGEVAKLLFEREEK